MDEEDLGVDLKNLVQYFVFAKAIDDFVFNNIRFFIDEIKEVLFHGGELGGYGFVPEDGKRGLKEVWNLTFGDINWIAKNTKTLPIFLSRNNTPERIAIETVASTVRETVMEDMQINPVKWIKYFDLAKSFLEGNNK